MLRRIAEYIVQHPAETTLMSVDEFADNVGVSVASVYRFNRELGYQTFSRLKLAIAKGIASQVDHVPTSAEKRSTLDLLFLEYIQCLEDSNTYLDEALASTVARVVARSRKIVLVGIGASGIAAQYMHIELLKAGITAHCPIDQHLAFMLVANMQANDVLIAFSASGATVEIVEMAQLASERSAAVVGITSYFQSPLEEITTHHLLAVAADSPISSGSGSSVISQFAVVEAILDCLGDKKIVADSPPA